MIRISITEKEKNYRYLVSRGGESDDFGKWLEKLGLNKLPYGLTLSDFINEGWIQPVLRIDMPESYYLTWKNYPELSGEFDPIPEEDKWSYHSDPDKLWNSSLKKDDKEWFLHPYDRTEGEAKDFLKHAVSISKELPPESKHPNGHIISPYLWYFAHWQGYMLIDLLPRIIFCDCIPDTQKAPDRLEDLKKNYHLIKERRRTSRNRAIQKWEDYKVTFTWLSYYRTMCGITQDRGLAGRLIKQGATELAKHLNIDILKFEYNFQYHLLVLFQQWSWRIKDGDVFCKNALTELRKDIYLALDWLCLLTGNDVETYFKKWSYQSMNQMEWAELKTVLPDEDIAIKQNFLIYAPVYLKDFNKYLPANEQIDKTKLEELVSKLWNNSISFRPFCRSFYNLLKLLKSDEDIDFRSNAFIDYFLAFTLRAEVVLAEVLNINKSGKSKSLSSIIKQYQDSFKKSKHLFASFDFISLEVKDDDKHKNKNKKITYWQELTYLYDLPGRDDPSKFPFNMVKEEINKTKNNFFDEKFQDEINREIAKQFASHLLNFGIARNYFAHHSYYDNEMIKRENARLALVSPLVSVLFLSAAKLGIL